MTDEGKAVAITANMIDSARQFVLSLLKYRYLSKKDIVTGVALAELIIMDMTLWQWNEEHDPKKKAIQIYLPALSRDWLKTQAEMDEKFLEYYDKLIPMRMMEYQNIKNNPEGDIGMKMAKATYNHMKGSEQTKLPELAIVYKYIIGFMKQIDMVWISISKK